MSEPLLTIKRQDGILTVTQDDESKYKIAVTSSAPLTTGEVDRIEAVIGEDDDGKRLVAKLRDKLRP